MPILKSIPEMLSSSIVGYICLFTAYLRKSLRMMNKSNSSPPLPPGPRPWPLIGCLPQMLRNKPVFQWIHKVMEENCTEIACIRLGNVHVIPVTSPALSYEFLKRRDEIFSSRPISMSADLISHGYLTTALSPLGEQHKKMRKILAAYVLSPKMHRLLHDKRVEEADHTVRYVYNQCKSGLIVNVRIVAHHYCGNVIRKLTVGRRFFGKGMEDGGPGPEEEEHVNGIYTLLDYLYAFCISDYLPFFRVFDIDGHERILKRAVQSARKYQDPEVDERIRLWDEGVIEKEERDILDILIGLKDVETGKALLTPEEIKAQILELTMASIDNPSNAVEWTLAEMLNQPQILQTAVREVDEVVGTERWVQESDLPRLNYLKACLKETFRLHPIAPFNLPHVSIADAVVAGYFIPKGSHVLLSRLGLGRNSRVWKDEPSEYKPERHLMNNNGGEVVLSDSELHVLTFSTGRRGCPGILLGTTITCMLLARLVQGFSWSLPTSMANPIQRNTVASGNILSAKPLLAKAKPRLPKTLYL